MATSIYFSQKVKSEQNLYEDIEAFLYCWTDVVSNKLYVGWHKGQTDDGYVCSSKLMLREYSKRPKDFSRQILAVGTSRDMVALESAILNAENAKTNVKYYNMHNGNGLYFFKGHSEESKIKISQSKIGKRRPDVSLRNLTNNPTKDPTIAKKCGRNMQGSNNPSYGKKHSVESIELMSMNRKGKGCQPRSVETKRKMSESKLKYWAAKKEKCNGN